MSAANPNFGAYTIPDNGTGIFQRAWWVGAPWAHPMWHSYCVFLFDLTSPTQEPPTLYFEGATHEMQVWALDPGKNDDLPWPPRRLSPPNYIYQFKADSHEAAEQRILSIIARIYRGELSPDTDFIRVWDALYPDWVSARAKRGTLQ